ncbi:MAG: class I SAM-dependent methyltransferase [Gammaproteobacteria bacterium]
MTQTVHPALSDATGGRVMGRAHAWLRGRTLQRLRDIQGGEILLRDGAGEIRLGRPVHGLPAATVQVHDPAFWPALAFGGSVGAGESYARGHWSCDDLTGLCRILLRSTADLDAMESGLARLSAPARAIAHRLRRNSRAGSRRNIAAHYDVGNDFFAAFLDQTMMYSCAIFEHPRMTLAEAQIAKLARICRKLELGPGDHVLEIGTGWGGFAIHAARHHGCRVTTTTISPAQHRLAVERVRAAGLSDRIEVLQADYRDLRGRYDKLVSIEMIEAVGHDHFDAYFRQCAGLLADHGMMLLQAITIDDRRYEYARDSVDFIKRHIFPGACLPSVSVIAASLARCTDLRVFHLEDIGPHYATTLRHWRERLGARRGDVLGMGYAQALLRAWEFYLCYCEAGFLERSTGDVQMLLVKPGNRRAPLPAGP